MRVRVRHADDFAFVLENENLINLRSRPQVLRLSAPRLDDLADVLNGHPRQRQIVARGIADHACDTVGAT